MQAPAEPPSRLVELPALEDVQKELAQRRLKHYMRYMWPVVEPTTPFVPGWHLDAVCDHLEAVRLGIKNENAVGAIRRLIINIPPRMTKSLTVSVGFPTHIWIDVPSFRSIHTSYSQDLSVRDSVKSRAVIQSPWYQRNWGDRFRLSGDVNLKSRYENDKTGFRLATSVTGMATGEGGDGIFIDDPHNVKDTLATSGVSLQEVMDWFDFVLPSRFNNQKTGFLVLIMQRVHHKDLTGHILAKELGYTHLCLPMEYEANHPHKWAADPRSIEGELLCPARVGPAELATLTKSLGVYGSAGQLQQRPAPREGGIVKRAWFQVVDNAPAVLERVVRWWDMAATEKKAGNDPDWTAGGKVGIDGDGNAYVLHSVAERESSFAVERLIAGTAAVDGHDVDVWMEQEPGSAGKTVIATYSRKLSGQLGYKFRGEPSTGDKGAYIDVLAGAMESGTVFWVRGPWLERVIDQACAFPNADHDDEIEAIAKAYCKLATRVRAGVRTVDAHVQDKETAKAPQYVPGNGHGNDEDIDVVRAGAAGAVIGDDEVDFEAVAEANARAIYGDAVVDNWNEHAARGME